MNKIYFLIGASGSGKSTTLKASKALLVKQFYLLHFDSIGVPTFNEMKKQYGSIEDWQRIKTFEWAEKMKKQYLSKRSVVFDAQTRPSFIKEACLLFDINYDIILFDCNDSERKKRLTERNHEELADENMMKWAAFLRSECQSLECKIFDNTKKSVKESVQQLLNFLGNDKQT